MSTTDFDRLVSEIVSGNCIAFVGAGFSAQQVGGWASLIARLAEEDGVTKATRAYVRTRIATDHPSNRDLEIAAQLIADDLGEPSELARRLQVIAGSLEPEGAMASRVEWLQGIPFRAVLTTNFDNLLSGRLPGRDAYLEALRPKTQGWWQDRYWLSSGGGAPVIKLHGDINTPDPGPILTRRAYRALLYGDPAYTTFLKSLFATTTVLYLGFSFTDAYLDELRSEILALVDHRKGDAPLAYALIPNATPEQIGYMRDHEGISLFTYDSGEGHGGFDEFLHQLWEATNPLFILGRTIKNRRILWLDPLGPTSDAGEGAELLRMAADRAGGRTEIAFAEGMDQALELLESRDHGWDLVITHWGHGRGRGDHLSVATSLLASLRERDIRVPVMVFSAPAFSPEQRRHSQKNRDRALSMGALAYLTEWSSLFRELERLWDPEVVV